MTGGERRSSGSMSSRRSSAPRIDTLSGARTWTGHWIFAHNLVKVGRSDPMRMPAGSPSPIGPALANRMRAGFSGRSCQALAGAIEWRAGYGGPATSDLTAFQQTSAEASSWGAGYRNQPFPAEALADPSTAVAMATLLVLPELPLPTLASYANPVHANAVTAYETPSLISTARWLATAAEGPPARGSPCSTIRLAVAVRPGRGRSPPRAH